MKRHSSREVKPTRKDNSDKEAKSKVPSRENFEEYFSDFFKMFQQCKYNLIALNKRFDSMEKFFKEYSSKDNVFSNADQSQGVYEETGKVVKSASKKKSNGTKETPEEESFPFSMEDLEYLTRNFIPETEPVKSVKKVNRISKGKKSKYDVIIIDKKNMRVESLDDLDPFAEKQEIEEVQQDTNGGKEVFSQNFFDYKNFSKAPEKIKADEGVSKVVNDDCAWIKVKDEDKTNTEDVLNPDLAEKRSKTMSEFIKMKKERLLQQEEST